MKVLSKVYYYIFYRFYKLFDSAPSRWWSEGKAGAAMTLMTIFLVFTIEGYYSISTRKNIIPENNGKLIVSVLAFVIGAINYFIFAHNQRWQNIVLDFEKHSESCQRVGKLLFWFVILFLFVNMVYMFYLTSQIDWEND
jgi:hypothetical protein